MTTKVRTNFYCIDCDKDFTKSVERIEEIETPYGKQFGIVCPLCGGRAKLVGRRTVMGGNKDISEHSKMIDLDR